MNLLTKEEIHQVAVQVAKDKNVVVDEHEICPPEGPIVGYLGKHLSLKLSLSCKKSKWDAKFFVKTYEVKKNKDDFLGETGIFQREQDFYGAVVRDVNELLGVPDWCPNFYFSKKAVIILEDLSEKGFKMAEDSAGVWALTTDYVEAGLRALASMHADSMALERKMSKTLPQLYPDVFEKEILYDENKVNTPTRKWLSWQIQDLTLGLNYLNRYSQVQKCEIQHKFEKQIMRIYELSKKSEKYRNVLTHGDMWKNNLLFRKSDEDSKSECRLVDYQFIRYAPPAHDIMHLLHFSMLKEDRDRHIPRLLNLYYECLRNKLKKHGVEVETQITEEELMESCERYRELALIQCLLSLHYILGPVSLSPEAETYDKYEEFLAQNRVTYMYRFFQLKHYFDRINDLFQDLIDNYILKS